MLKITLKEFQDRGFYFLSQLPIALTKYGRVVAVVNEPDGDPKVEEVKEKLKSLGVPKLGGRKVPVLSDIEKNILQNLTNAYNTPSGRCPHGYYVNCPTCQ